MTLDIRSNYLGPIFNPAHFKLTVESTVSMAKRLKGELDFDTLVFSGTSGIVMGSLLAHVLDVPMLCVRKPNDGSHYATWRGPLEGNMGLQRYLIVDDFISTGGTVRYMIDKIEDERTGTKCVGILMYTQFPGNKPHLYQHQSWKDPVTIFTSRPSSI